MVMFCVKVYVSPGVVCAGGGGLWYICCLCVFVCIRFDIHDAYTPNIVCVFGSVCVFVEMCVHMRENAEDNVLIAAGSVFPLCNESFCQRPGVDLCHQEWYLSLVQKRGRHVEPNKEQEERRLYSAVRKRGPDMQRNIAQVR